ncbi:MAG: hypothetical protein ABI321_19125 [Polyangia bacterium]
MVQIAHGDPSKLDDTRARVESSLKTLFSPPSDAGWTMEVTPFVPASWPPDGAVIAYAYARRIEPGLQDGYVVAHVWAKARISRDGTLAIEHLADRVVELGIQGFRPVATAEIERTVAEGRRAQASFLSARSLGDIDASAARAFFRTWRDFHGLIHKEVAARHPAFFTWADAMPFVAKPPAFDTAVPNRGIPFDPQTLPSEIATWIGPHTIYASGGGVNVVPWRVVVQLDLGRMRSGEGQRAGAFVAAELTETVRADANARPTSMWKALDTRTLAELRTMATRARGERPATAGDETLIIGSDAGAYYLSGRPTIATPAARALILRLRMLSQ